MTQFKQLALSSLVAAAVMMFGGQAQAVVKPLKSVGVTVGRRE